MSILLRHFWDYVSSKAILNHLGNIVSNDIPVLSIEHPLKLIRSQGFEGVHTSDTCFISSTIGTHRISMFSALLTRRLGVLTNMDGNTEQVVKLPDKVIPYELNQ